MNTIEIKTHRDFEDVCDDILTEFIDSLFEDPDKYIDYFDDAKKELWRFSKRGERLYTRYVHRLTKIGESMFPNDVLTIRSWLTFDID